MAPKAGARPSLDAKPKAAKGKTTPRTADSASTKKGAGEKIKASPKSAPPPATAQGTEQQDLQQQLAAALARAEEAEARAANAEARAASAEEAAGAPPDAAAAAQNSDLEQQEAALAAAIQRAEAAEAASAQAEELSKGLQAKLEEQQAAAVKERELLEAQLATLKQQQLNAGPAPVSTAPAAAETSAAADFPAPAAAAPTTPAAPPQPVERDLAAAGTSKAEEDLPEYRVLIELDDLVPSDDSASVAEGLHVRVQFNNGTGVPTSAAATSADEASRLTAATKIEKITRGRQSRKRMVGTRLEARGGLATPRATPEGDTGELTNLPPPPDMTLAKPVVS